MSWGKGALALPLAYAVGIVLAACVCLPSFYFFSLLAGVKMSWLQLVSVLGKGMAANAVLLLGILPIYVALAMGLLIARAPESAAMDAGGRAAAAVRLGLVGFACHLPGHHGLVGDAALRLAVPAALFLRGLTFSWAAVYAAVVPVMIFRLWESFAALCTG